MTLDDMIDDTDMLLEELTAQALGTSVEFVDYHRYVDFLEGMLDDASVTLSVPRLRVPVTQVRRELHQLRLRNHRQDEEAYARDCLQTSSIIARVNYLCSRLGSAQQSEQHQHQPKAGPETVLKRYYGSLEDEGMTPAAHKTAIGLQSSSQNPGANPTLPTMCTKVTRDRVSIDAIRRVLAEPSGASSHTDGLSETKNHTSLANLPELNSPDSRAATHFPSQQLQTLPRFFHLSEADRAERSEDTRVANLPTCDGKRSISPPLHHSLLPRLDIPKACSQRQATLSFMFDQFAHDLSQEGGGSPLRKLQRSLHEFQETSDSMLEQGTSVCVSDGCEDEIVDDEAGDLAALLTPISETRSPTFLPRPLPSLPFAWAESDIGPHDHESILDHELLQDGSEMTEQEPDVTIIGGYESDSTVMTELVHEIEPSDTEESDMAPGYSCSRGVRPKYSTKPAQQCRSLTHLVSILSDKSSLFTLIRHHFKCYEELCLDQRYFRIMQGHEMNILQLAANVYLPNDIHRQTPNAFSCLSIEGDETLLDYMDTSGVSNDGILSTCSSEPTERGGTSRLRGGAPSERDKGMVGADMSFFSDHLRSALDTTARNVRRKFRRRNRDDWALYFINSRGNEYFCDIDEEYLTDRFNLTSLNTEVQYYQYALDLVTDMFDVECEDDMRESIEKSARHLYGLVHARYIVTTRGLQKMCEKFKTGDFGKCPRVACDGQHLLPMGQNDGANLSPVKLYCAKCEDLYNPKSSRHATVDGAYFGTSFHNMFFQVYPNLVPAKTQRRYEPRVFGFRLHASAALARWQADQKDGMKERLKAEGMETGFEEEDREQEERGMSDDEAGEDGIDDMFEAPAIPARVLQGGR